jgi:hypothetical protein
VVIKSTNSGSTSAPLVDQCRSAYGMDGRPPYLTKTERRRFESAYYLVAALSERRGGYLLDTLALRQLYYVVDVAQLWIPIGEEPRDPRINAQRENVRRLCWERLKQLRCRFWPDRPPRAGILPGGPRSYGCFIHVALFDHCQEDIEYELSPTRLGTNISPEDWKEFVWGDDSGDDVDV